jgi:2-keto-3-deoxy-L-rhamnonate aldolase RhmA
MVQRPFTLTLFTNDPEVAKQADQAGIDRIGPDLEIIGKVQRQGHLDTRISHHTIDDFVKIRACLQHAHAFARVNPIHPQSALEIHRLLDLGAEVLMLPMFSSCQEVQRFVELIQGRAKVVLLVETALAGLRLRQILALPGIDEIHFGLNDLQLSFGANNGLEIVQSDFMQCMCKLAQEKGIAYGIGGVANVDATDLPIHPESYYQEYVRLGSSGAIVSRSFLKNVEHLGAAVAQLRARLTQLQAAN